ncbi:SMI1/KNR4 family protein [bacterium]|nr:SMI1/KNR4 family protein [bacterium]
MRETSIGQLKDTYQASFGVESTDPIAIEMIESRLGIILPNDFKEIASFYAGGIIGTFPHLAIAEDGPADNIVDQTLFLRKRIDLPVPLVVIVDFNSSLIILNCRSGSLDSKVFWVTSKELTQICNFNSFDPIEEWANYKCFFESMLASTTLDSSGDE